MSKATRESGNVSDVSGAKSLSAASGSKTGGETRTAALAETATTSQIVVSAHSGSITKRKDSDSDADEKQMHIHISESEDSETSFSDVEADESGAFPTTIVEVDEDSNGKEY